MGSSYGTVLVAADIEAVGQALEALDQEAVIAAAATRRTAVVPGRGDFEAGELARELSRVLGVAAASWVVADSDLVTATIFAKGKPVHRYLSDQDMEADVVEDGDGLLKIRIEGVLYPLDQAPERGPAGVRAEPFVPLGSSLLDRGKLESALRGGPHEAGTPWLFAENQHRLIIEALGVKPDLLILDFDHARDTDLPGARHICEPRPEDDYWTVPDE